MSRYDERIHASDSASPENNLTNKDDSLELTHALSKLREDERLLLNLRYSKGLSISEVADLLGTSENSVIKRISRAKENLRKVLEG